MSLADHEFMWRCEICGGWNQTQTNPPDESVCQHCGWVNVDPIVREVESDRAHHE